MSAMLAPLSEKDKTVSHQNNHQLPLQILVIDNDGAGRTLVKRALCESGLHVKLYEAADTATGGSILRNYTIDCLLLDHQLLDTNELDVLMHIVEESEEKPLPVVVLTDIGNETIAAHALKFIAQDYLLKNNISSETLRRTITRVVEVSTLEDQHRQTKERLRKLSCAIEQSASTVLITDKSGVIEYVNPSFSRVTGYAADEVIGLTPSILRSPETSSIILQELWTTITAGRDWRGELINLKKNGQTYRALMTISPIRDANGEISHFVGVSEDITELHQTRADLERLAFYDMLTGLENRQLFRKRLEQALKISERNQSHTAVLVLDLDNFKRINDSLGHDAGDTLLKVMAHRLRDCVRQADCLARLGGDEFGILLTDIDTPTHASITAQKILDTLCQPINLANHQVIVGASLGITIAPPDGTDANELIKNADLAMYRAKALGRNNYKFFTDGMNHEAAERLHLEQALRKALTQNELTLYFQPMVELDTLRPAALEVLVRWQHPERGMISPDYFIGIAEETGLIVPLGEWVLREACLQAKALDAQGMPPMKIAINLSARQFRDPELATTVGAILRETGLEPTRLELELTESMLMHNIDEAIAIMHQLKELGVALSIDDFGTGYSSLNYLKRFPIDTLKVDRCFLQDVPQDSENAEITSAVIAMAHKLQLKVVAEGVETEAQLRFLKQNQCDFCQGYLFSQPQPLEHIVAASRSLSQ